MMEFACRTLLFVLASLSSGFAQTAPAKYEIYAIRYATIPQFPVAGLVKGADPARKLDIAMTIWLVKGQGRNILVDSGFYREQLFKQWKVENFVKLSDAIAKVGLKPEDIPDVVIT